MAVLIDHFEARLGRMTGGWAASEGAPEGAPQIGCFRNGQLGAVDSFATIGLHSTPLGHADGDRHFHLELVSCCHPRAGGAGPLPDIVEYVAAQLIRERTTLLRGDVVRLPVPVVPGGVMNWLYAAIPVYFDDDFSSVTVENGADVVVVWLFPIGDNEAKFVASQGWEAFEQELIRQDPDLLDLERPEITL